jgi:hypothetical protein
MDLLDFTPGSNAYQDGILESLGDFKSMRRLPIQAPESESPLG